MVENRAFWWNLFENLNNIWIQFCLIKQPKKISKSPNKTILVNNIKTVIIVNENLLIDKILKNQQKNMIFKKKNQTWQKSIAKIYSNIKFINEKKKQWLKNIWII